VEQAVDLADMIWQLRSELTRAMWGGDGKDLRFVADTVELELSVAVERAQQPGAKVNFWVLEANAGGKQSSVVTQKIRLVLRPVRGDDPSRPAAISGGSMAGEDRPR
jgi:NTP-dependent ternary system trypsin peptidase co-occuring protein